MLHMGLLLLSAYLISGPIWTSYPKKLMFLYIYLQFQVSNLHIHDQQQMDFFFTGKVIFASKRRKKQQAKTTASMFRPKFTTTWSTKKKHRHFSGVCCQVLRHIKASASNHFSPTSASLQRPKPGQALVSTAWGNVTPRWPALASPTNPPPSQPVVIPWPLAMDDSTTTTFGPSGDAAAASTLVTYGAANVGETTLSSCALEEVYRGCFFEVGWGGVF